MIFTNHLLLLLYTLYKHFTMQRMNMKNISFVEVIVLLI